MRIFFGALLQWAFYLAILVFCLSILTQATVFTLSGTSEGNGSHVMTVEFVGDNLTRDDGILLLAYKGYAVQVDGTVWLNNESRNVTGAM